ncbi:MAG: hypothetical protein IJ867_08140 [Clostridia bacterium]|nr:hypothetical protein [Clostridia bacterium]
MSASVDQAYNDILPSGKYGFVILNLEMDPAKVDCNVHPAKLEVRFEEEQKVFKAVYHAIKSKNEMIMAKAPKTAEIENQEQIEPEEKVEEPAREEFKPREGTFSGFFKFFNKKEEDEQEENTLIQDIYEARKSGSSNWGSFDTTQRSEEPATPKKEEPIITETIEETVTQVVEEEERKPQEVKFGNTIISSDTRESAYSVSDLMDAAKKEETLKLDTTKLFSADNSKTEIIDSLKKMEEEKNRDTVILNTEEVRSEIKVPEENVEEVIEEKEIKTETLDNNTIAERLLEQKVKSDMDDTQFVDTGKVRSELRKSKQVEDVPVTKDFANMYKKVFGTEVSMVRKTKEEENAKLDFSSNIQAVEEVENETVFEAQPETQEEAPKIKYRFIGTIFDTYAIIEVKDEMYMIEKNAAEERLMYEVVKKDYYEEKDNSVTLLLADIVTLSPKEMSMARDLLEMFQKAGFDYDEFGESTLKLTKVPNWAESLNTKKLFLEILREMDTVAITATKEKEDKFISTVSNKFVELSDTSLTEQELEDLIKRLLKLPSPFMYPNGRLTAVKISKANMEKKFSRR